MHVTSFMLADAIHLEIKKEWHTFSTLTIWTHTKMHFCISCSVWAEQNRTKQMNMNCTKLKKKQKYADSVAEWKWTMNFFFLCIYMLFDWRRHNLMNSTIWLLQVVWIQFSIASYLISMGCYLFFWAISTMTQTQNLTKNDWNFTAQNRCNSLCVGIYLSIEALTTTACEWSIV